MDLILIRHALPQRADGDAASADPPLSSLGHRQADATARFLAREPIDHVVVSPLQRAQQTAQPLCHLLDLKFEIVEGLRESDPFGGSYIPAEEVSTDHPIVTSFAEDPLSLFANDGGFERFRAGVIGALDEVVAANRGRTVAAFCHGTVIGSYLTAVIGHEDPFLLLPDYCGLYRLKASLGGVRTLRSANETGHVRELLPAGPWS